MIDRLYIHVKSVVSVGSIDSHCHLPQATLQICIDSVGIFQLSDDTYIPIGSYNSDGALLWVDTIDLVGILKFCPIVEAHLRLSFHNFGNIGPNKCIRGERVQNNKFNNAFRKS